jgi:hypothetical protein
MRSPRWPAWTAAALGFVWYIQLGGWPTLDPTNLAWLFSGDWKQHVMGWLMFRQEPWTVPLGTLSQSLYPIGSTIGFTDSNPLVSVLLKPLAGALPAEVQFIGPWLALCYVLQGYAGARLASVVTSEPAEQALGGFLFVLTPVLIARFFHDTLCAHWLVLALLYLGLRAEPAGGQPLRTVGSAIGLLMIASAVHPYLAAMTWTLGVALYVKLWRIGRLSRRGAGLSAAAATLCMLGVLALFGYIGRSQVAGVGFGEYSSDLLTFLNPMDHSNLLPALPMKPWQGEGYGFLGVGGLLLVALSAGVMVSKRRLPSSDVWPVVVACVLMGVYALSGAVTIGGRDLINIDWLYRLLAPVVAPFRASGRFIWPLHYLMLTFGLWGVWRVLSPARRTIGTALVGIAVGLQAADVNTDRWWASAKTFRQVPTAEFKPAEGHFKHLALVPMQVFGVCTDRWDEDYVYRFMLHAYRLKLTFNSGIFARLPADDVRAACRALAEATEAGRFDPQTLYAVPADRVDRFRALGAVCGRFDGDWVCVDRASDHVFRTYLETGRVIPRAP